MRRRRVTHLLGSFTASAAALCCKSVVAIAWRWLLGLSFFIGVCAYNDGLVGQQLNDRSGCWLEVSRLVTYRPTFCCSQVRGVAVCS